jgi:2-methylisocitrate lyase-like PEP mutase family enzyme
MVFGNELIVAPGATTALFARLVENAGFPIVYATGAGLANMNYCLPDYNLITMTENLEMAKRLNDAVAIPVVADIDDGYGAPINVYRTAREYSKIGIAGIQMEDQQNPKRCGHFEDHIVIPTRDMIAKIKAAKDGSMDPDMVLIARTDAISATGSFEEAIERANAYAEAGADMIFVEAPSNLEQITAIPQRVKIPVILNIVEKGKTPMIPNNEIERLGYRMVIYANASLKASILGVERLLEYLKENETTDGCDNELMITSIKRHELLDKDSYQDLIRKYQ